MKSSKFHFNGKTGIAGIILRASVSLYLAGIVGIAQVDTAQAARWGGGGGGNTDRTAPTVPTGLTATAASSSQINLSWKASSDSVGVKGYKVYQGGAQIATVSSTSFSNTGLSPSTTYKYTVAAYDAAGNTSAQSSSASATTSSSSGGGSGGSADGVPSGVPAGIYSIDNVVDQPFVDGVLVRIYWDKSEPQENQYSFTNLDSTVQKAISLGQSVTIAPMVMAVPTWLESKCATYNDPQFGKTCVPWDATGLSALQNFINALSTHQINGTAIKDLTSVRQINASLLGMQSVRLTTTFSGYSASKMKDAAITTAGYWASAFPKKNLYLGLFDITDNTSNPSTTEDIRDTLLAQYGSVMSFFQEVMTGSAPQTNSILGENLLPAVGKTGIMLQACGEWSNQNSWSYCNFPKGDTPSAGMSNGFNNYKATYFEFYDTDLNNSSYSSQFQQWHDTLKPYIP
ncbi:fibronectin type III domain-containing protein [Methylosarcina fibrata]|uniref:fibronectin type III domain-containing protein n=1 Tax=Methylosarcina fibrata TaxID=105972 RepID=UPI00036D5FF3|nr:fibronectin type III domain-containing protein [Methylosarcina fibrata]